MMQKIILIIIYMCILCMLFCDSVRSTLPSTMNFIEPERNVNFAINTSASDNDLHVRVDQVSSDVTVTSHKTEVVTATEKMTTAATTAKTTVIKKTVKRQSGQPPRFVKPIQPQVVREGESAEFIAGVTGAPLPDITWLKDKVEVRIIFCIFLAIF